MAPRRRCPICGSRQWHKERSRGLIACSEGHILQNYRNEATETDTVDVRTLRKRALKSGREREVRSRVNSELYYGARGRYLYFQCLQVLLRKQIATLIRLWQLPKEFEMICRDMWALHLDMLPNPPIAETDDNMQGRQDRDMSSMGQRMGKLGKEESEHQEERSEDGGSDVSDLDEGEHEDPELSALLRANSELGDSLSESDNSEEGDGPAGSSGKTKNGQMRKPKGLYSYETPTSTVAILLIACWTLRIPALPRDFIKLIQSYELPYLDPIVRQLLPENMVGHLTKHNVQALSPYHAPSVGALHRLASWLSKKVYSSYKIFTPEVNAAPILWRVVSQGLGGTPMLYRLTKRLGDILSLPLTLHDTLAPGLNKRNAYDPERQVYDNLGPEVGFIAVAIIVLKMVYGLDGRARFPKDLSNVACVFPRLDEYLVRLSQLEGREAKNKDDVIFDARSDVYMGDASEEMIDDYLTFCKRVLVGGRDGDTVLDRYFPLSAAISQQEDQGEREDDNFQSLRATLMNDDIDSGSLLPGEGYRIYRGQDIEGKKTEEFKLVIGRAARWTGVDDDYLGRVIETYERRLARWWVSNGKAR